MKEAAIVRNGAERKNSGHMKMNRRPQKIHPDRAVLLSLVMLSWPTILEELLATVVQYIDTAMVGNLGAEATAAVSLSSTYTWLINSVIHALGVGFLAYIARAIGEKDEYKVHKAAGQAVLVTIVIGLLLTVITLVIAPFMPGWMGAETAIRADASKYFFSINLPLLLRSATIIFGAVIRSTGDTKSPMAVNLIVNGLNIVFNYFFIYFFGMGAVGAGVASAISFSIGGILMCMLFVRNPMLGILKEPRKSSRSMAGVKQEGRKPGRSMGQIKQEGRKFRRINVENLKLERTVLGGILAIGFPIMLTQVASCSGYVVATSFVSSMATAVYAAHSIAITAETIFYIPGYGMQAATATLIGNAIGEGDRNKERDVKLFAIAIIFGLMCVTGLLLYFSAGVMMSLFTREEEVIRIGTRLLRIVAFTEPIFGTAAVLGGIYEGMGRTKYPFAIELLTRWGIRILGSYICVRIFSMGIEAVWYCMIGDNILKAVLLIAGLGNKRAK